MEIDEDLGQLAPLRWALIPEGSRWYLERKRAQGLRVGDVKVPALDPRWEGDLADLELSSV